MTPEQIQAIRDKYKYNPATLKTSSSSSIPTAISLNDFTEQPQAQQKTTTQKVASVASEIVKPFERVGGAVLNLLPGQEQAQRQGLFGNQVDAVGYRDGQQLQGGEFAKDVAGTILDVGSFAIPVGTGAKVLTKVAKGIQAGAVAGGLAGTGRALQEGQSIPEAIGQGAVSAVGGAVLGGAIPTAVGGAVGLKNKLNPSEKFIESKILKEYTKGVKPLLPGKSTPATLANYNDNVIKAVKTIKNNKSNLSFETEAGELVTGKTPENLNQLTHAIEQTKKKIFTEYDTLAKTAGKEGVGVDVNPIAKELDTVINDKALAITNPNAINHAQQLQDRLRQTGRLDAQTAQDVIQNYNKSLEAFYRNPSYENASNAAIDSVVANNMRKALDDGITGLTGTEYQALKNQYGALKSVEKDVIKASLRDARKNTKGLIDFTDVFSGGQVVSGILSMNPATVATGATQKAIASIYKHLNDPNRAVMKMFEAADIPVGGIVKQLSKSPRGMIDFGELGRAFTPSEKSLVKEALADLKLAKSENGRLLMLQPVKNLLLKERVLSKNGAFNSNDIEEAALRSLEDSDLVLATVKNKEMSTPMINKVNDRFIKNPTTGKLEGSKKAVSEDTTGVPVFRGQSHEGLTAFDGANKQRFLSGMDGTSFSLSKESAKNYGDKIVEGIVPNNTILRRKDLSEELKNFIESKVEKLSYDDYVDGTGFENVVSELARIAKGRKKNAIDLTEFFPKSKIDDEIRVLNKDGIKVTPKLPPLEQVAKKYKSADEFVKAQGTSLYSGSKAKFEQFDFNKANKGGLYGNSAYMTPDIKRASSYGDNITEYVIPKNAKLLKESDFESRVRSIIPSVPYGDITVARAKAVEQFIKEGYDGVKTKDTTAIFNPKALQTKSQLKEIWNKANKK